MEQTLQALSGILLKATVTAALLILLHWYFKLMLFGPLDKVLKQRREMTDGARKAAEKSLEAADRKARDFEDKLRDARSQVYKEQEETRRKWLEDQAQQIADARKRMEDSVHTAKQTLAAEVTAAKNSLETSTSTLADQIASTVLSPEGRMKRLLLVLVLAATPFFAQEHKEGEKAGEAKHAEGDPMAVWKWANFAILAVVLGYIAQKQLGALFATRSEEIRKGIADAQVMKADAEKRAAEIDARVSALGTEIEKIRTESTAEMQREGERIRQETATAIGKVEQQAAFEIESAGKLAHRELKEYAANLALNLAEQRIRQQMNAASEGTLIDNFVSDLAKQGSKN